MPEKSHKKPALEFKSSTFSVPVLVLNVYDETLIQAQIDEKIKLAPEFFKNSPVILDLHELNKNNVSFDLIKLLALLRESHLFVIGLRHGNDEQNEIALKNYVPLHTGQNLPDIKNVKNTQAVKNSVEKEDVTEELGTTLMITKPIRSGQRIYSQGDLIVLAQVSEGAEILAEGNIHVYGNLRGKALAGVPNNTQARIFCSSLQAELISIAGNYKVMDEIKKDEHYKQSVQIYLQKNTLVVENIA